MIYLLLGEDGPAKSRKINEIKTACLPSNDALQFDYEFLDSVKLNPAELKKALIALPAVAPKRLILLRAVEKLSAHNKEIISDFIWSDSRHAVLVLDSDASSLKGDFSKKVMSAAEVSRFGKKEKKSDLWDVARAIEARNPGKALKTLNTLFQDGEAPLKILGGLVWFWGSIKTRLSADGFKKGLLVLQEADLNIKRSRLDPEHAIEIVVTKLSSLIAC